MTHIESSVMDCCGITGIVGIRDNEDEFIDRLTREFFIEYCDGYDGETIHKTLGPALKKRVKGAFFQVNINNTQKKVIKKNTHPYLLKYGFKQVAQEKNTNSGNYVSVWLATREEFIDKFVAELQKKGVIEECVDL